MEKIETCSAYELYASVEELNAEDKNLLMRAQKATQTAYAPYSDYHVGAAVLLENGVVVTGSNQENAAYPSGLCAERVAVFAAGAHNPDVKIKSIAIAAYAGGNPVPRPVSPCGDCRQVMAEYEHRYKHAIRLIMQGENGKVIIIDNVKALLPFMFSADNL
ncbi:MAG: cytidine deaminase [Bacteroidetes bacterium]|nr:cytidine deaminase [Bacteroidota bacterium]